MAAPTKKIRILIVDDSAVVRNLLAKLISTDPELEVVGQAEDPYQAREKLVELKPDVMTLDHDMPRMNGVAFLQKVMKHFPVRTLFVSGMTANDSAIVLQALEAGAIDVLDKPKIDMSKPLKDQAQELILRLKTVARAKLAQPAQVATVGAVGQAANLVKAPHSRLAFESTLASSALIAIASSTGGTEALKVVLRELPAGCPPILIVQHMPPVFTKAYAETLSRICDFPVYEAKDGDVISPGKAWLAPGGYHMELESKLGNFVLKLHQEPLLHGVRPAADFLFRSIARLCAKRTVGVVLTGMGKDGAAGLLEMKRAGSYVFGQDEASCVVYGMPKAAHDMGALNEQLPLDRIAAAVLNRLRSKKAA